MLKSFIGADMRLYERFGIGSCSNPETKYSGMKGTKLQTKIVQEYLDDPQKLNNEAKAIIKKYGGHL